MRLADLQHVSHTRCKSCKMYTVKPGLSGHSKMDKTKVSKTDGSLMQVKSIAECSFGAFCNTFREVY